MTNSQSSRAPVLYACRFRFKQTTVDYDVCIYVKVLALLADIKFASDIFVYVLSAGRFCRHVICQQFDRRQWRIQECESSGVSVEPGSSVGG